MIATQPHVLALDGSASLLAVIRELLEEVGYRVSTDLAVPTGSEEIRRLGPDLVVLDLLVGGQDGGWRLLRQLRQDPLTADLPIVVCTGATFLIREVGDELRALATEVVLKPFDIDELLAAVEEGIRSPYDPSRLKAQHAPS